MKMPSIPPGIPGGEKYIHHYLSPEPSCVSRMSAKHLGQNATSCANQGKSNRFFSNICLWITRESHSMAMPPDNSIADLRRLCQAAFVDISSFGLYLLGPSYSKCTPGASSTNIIRKLLEIRILRHDGKESSGQCRRHRSCQFNPWVGKIPWSKKWPRTPVFLPGKVHGRRRLAGYSP